MGFISCVGSKTVAALPGSHSEAAAGVRVGKIKPCAWSRVVIFSASVIWKAVTLPAANVR